MFLSWSNCHTRWVLWIVFLTTKFRNSGAGLGCVFLLTGFMGYTLAPIVNADLSMNNGSQLVMTALGGTGVIFLGLSGSARTSKKDFSFMGAGRWNLGCIFGRFGGYIF